MFYSSRHTILPYHGEGEIPSPPDTMTEFSIERVSGHNIADFLFLLTELALYEHLIPPDTESRSRLIRDILLYPPLFGI
jgi:hypothetical protein